MKKSKRISIQTKILTLIVSLILVVILLLSGVYIYFEKQQTEENMGKLAFQVSKTVSFMPSIRGAFESGDTEDIQSIAENVRHQVDAEYVVIANKDGIRFSYPDPVEIGKKMYGDDNYKALIFGQYFTSYSTSPLGPALTGKSPIFNDEGNIVGIVSVGFLLEDINSAIYTKVWNISKISLVALLLGIVGSVLLTRNIRKDTLGLEPHEISTLYRERSAILYAIKEGVIAVDGSGLITMMNQSARDILGFQKDYVQQPIEKILPNTQMYRVLRSGENEKNREMYLHERRVIVNREVITENGRTVGVVASFRDVTDIKEMIQTISEVRRYSEDLRAQTHEYMNKLYVLSGLIQLGQYDKAVDMIQSELNVNDIQNQILFDQINDSNVQAILLGKIGKASEQKIEFMIDRNSSLDPLPDHIDISSLITLLGNIIDNAFDAVSQHKDKKVTFFSTDIGNDIIFEIVDNGRGISAEQNIFAKGFTTKDGDDRGYGLAIVKDTVERLGGSIELKNHRVSGLIVTLFIPKKMDSRSDSHDKSCDC